MNPKKEQNHPFLPPQQRKESSYAGKSDTEVWRNFRHGDDGAFIFIYRNYISSLYNIGCQMTPREELVKDFLHDFFIELREKREHLGDTDSIKLYLFKSFRRRVITYLQKEDKMSSMKDFREYMIEFSIDTKIIDAQLSQDRLQHLKDAMNQLTHQEREIIYFFYYENMSYREIAEILAYDHISSARRYIYHLLKKLRDRMPEALALYLACLHASGLNQG